MSQIRPDFLDVSLLLTPSTIELLNAFSHRISDLFGNKISEHSAENLVEESIEISIEKITIAKLQTDQKSKPELKKLLEFIFLNEYQHQQQKLELESEVMASTDLENILRLSEIDTYSFEDQLRFFLRILRAHVWVEKASIFGIYDGFTLEGLAGIGGKDQSNWKMNFSTLAGEAATTRKVLHTENPKNEPNFQEKNGELVPRNLVCYPLIHGSTLVGVMNLSNRIGGQFTQADLKNISKFSYVATHLLQKHYFKKRMQSFEKASDHLGKYLSSKVVKNVKAMNQVELGGVEKKVVCLFSDIRGYTSITEDIPAPTLVKLLNFHFEKMTAIIDKYEGTVDKIVGDLIMAVWNIPHDQPEPELLAMKTAIEMQKEMIRTVIPEWLRHEIPKVGMGIGVNSGLALAGNLGSSRFMNYTVIGDAINTAQRLEAKAQAGEIWMAESMYEYVSGKVEKPIRKESAIRLKGKDKTIDAYVYKPLSY